MRSRPQLSEAVLLLRCQAGDGDAMESLYRRFGERTQRYLRGLLGDDADDVQQEVWAVVLRELARVSDVGAFRTWLFRVTRTTALDFLRRRKRLSSVFVTDDEAPDPASGSPPTDPLLRDLVRRGLDEVSAPHREVLLLRYWEDMSYAEIAVVLGEPVGTVRSRLHWARERLRDRLDPSLSQEIRS